MFRIIACANLLLLSTFANAALCTKDWDLYLGLGAIAAPKYEGSKNYRVLPIPYVDLEYKNRFFVSGERGIGVNFLDDKSNFKLLTSVNYSMSRKPDDDESLAGLDEIKGSARGQIALEYDNKVLVWGIKYNLPINHSDKGSYIDANFGSKYFIFKYKIFGSVKLGTTYIDKQRGNTYLGISADEAARTNYKAFKPDAGIQDIYLSFALIKIINPSLSFNVFAKASRFMGDYAKSPIVFKKNQFKVGMFIGYKVF